MSFWSRIANTIRPSRLARDLDEELQAHLDEAVEHGRDAAQARHALGSTLIYRDQSRDIRGLPWLDSIRADAIFGWRQLKKRKVTSTAAILSLALGIGACASAFRLVDAVLLRPLPIANPDRLYEVMRQGTDFDGRIITVDTWAYPAFRLMRQSVEDQAELIAVSQDARIDVTYGSDEDMEKAHLQYVSGSMFRIFGLKPAIGRLLTDEDDRTPGAHPYAVLSYDYWTRRFGQDSHIIGRTIRMGETDKFADLRVANGLFEIIGVVDQPFRGTETGTMTDIFVPTMMHPGAIRDDWTWHRTLAMLKPGIHPEPVRAKLHAVSQAFEEERAKRFKGMSRKAMEKSIEARVNMLPAAAGASGLQGNYRAALWALAVLVGLVLLIACANVANLMTAQASARAREIALRVSIGAGRGRLVQLVLVESAMIAVLAAAAGGLFAWWAAPFVVSRINPADNPARLDLPADWRVLAFGLALTLAVTLLFGLAPALRASAVKPSNALKGGSDPNARRRLMHMLIALQTAFCFLVLFSTGLFTATFERLAHRPIGFRADHLLTLDTVAQQPQAAAIWDQLSEHLRTMPGVESVALAGWPLLADGGWNGFISTENAPPGPVLGYFLKVSPGWVSTMKMSFVEGRDFRQSDTMPGAAIVNEAFVKQFLNGRHAIGTTFNKGDLRFEVVGVVRNVPYRSLREPDLPIAFVPMHSVDNGRALLPIRKATFLLRTSGADPLGLVSALRHEIPRARPGFRVSNIRTQQEIVDAQTIRERLLAMLASFFAMVALLLAGIGLYGVLDYTVLQQRREIGIRMALGARAAHVASGVAARAFGMVLGGAGAGIVLALMSAKYVASLLYQVKATDIGMLAVPSLAILAAAVVAAVPAVVRSVRIDPAVTLRTE